MWKGYETDVVSFLDENLPNASIIIDHEPDVYEHILSGGSTFVVSAVNFDKKIFKITEIFPDEEYDTEYTHEMTCPYCGHKEYDAWELRDDEGLTDCSHCGKEFRYSRDIEVTYSTKEGEMVNKIPVIVFKNKVKKDRYLAASMEVGDWNDPELDVSIGDIENAFIICRKDFSKPDGSDIENVIAESKWHIKYMREKFGEHAVVTFDVEKWLKFYDPVNLDITKRQYEIALDNLS